MTIAKIGKITGPPGCGKTTELKRLIDAACARYFPNEIGVVSYTNAAVEEIRGRIAKTLGEGRAVIRNVRTLHSHCYRLIERPEVGESHMADFNKEHPEFALGSIRESPDEDIPVAGNRARNNNRIFNDVQINRNRLVPRELWAPDQKKMHDAWMLWLDKNDYVDYTGMVERTLAMGLAPKIKILFVDEAQDLTPLQYAVAMKWADVAESTTFGGDSDQCIYRFSGSVPEKFIELPHQWNKHLDQSYRVSPAVHAYGEEIVKRIANRENTTYKPTDEYGPGTVYSVARPDLSLEGEHMIICRCNFHVNRWIRWLTKRGLLWKNEYRPGNKGWNPIETLSLEVVRTFYALLAGQEISILDLQKMVRKMMASRTLVRGAKKEILGLPTVGEVGGRLLKHKCDIDDLVDLGFLPTFIDSLSTIQVDDIFRLTGQVAPVIKKLPRDITRLEETLAGIRVTVGTIHSIKGGEADHVWLDVGTAGVILREMRASQAAVFDEHRVAYVAATRARKTLGLLTNSLRNPALPQISRKGPG